MHITYILQAYIHIQAINTLNMKISQKYTYIHIYTHTYISSHTHTLDILCTYYIHISIHIKSCTNGGITYVAICLTDVFEKKQ